MEDCLEAPSLGSLIDIRQGSQGADLKKEIIEKDTKRAAFIGALGRQRNRIIRQIESRVRRLLPIAT